MKTYLNNTFLVLIAYAIFGISQVIAQSNLTPTNTWVTDRPLTLFKYAESGYKGPSFSVPVGSEVAVLEEGKYFRTIRVQGQDVMVPKPINGNTAQWTTQLGASTRTTNNAGRLILDPYHNINIPQNLAIDPEGWGWVDSISKGKQGPAANLYSMRTPAEQAVWEAKKEEAFKNPVTHTAWCKEMWKNDDGGGPGSNMYRSPRSQHTQESHSATKIGRFLPTGGHLAREIHLLKTRDGGETNYPVGTAIEILSKNHCVGTIEDQARYPWVGAFIIQIGDTKEQCVVPWQAISEIEGWSGPTLTTTSIQFPDSESRIKNDGPAGNFTGVATGLEDISRNPAWETEALRLMNIERAKAGVCQLKWNEDMARAARYQSAAVYVGDYYMESQPAGEVHASYAPHIINGKKELYFRESGERLQRFTPDALAEIGGGSTQTDTRLAETIINGWMHSPPHKKLMLDPNNSEVGIGFGTGTAENSNVVALAVLGSPAGERGEDWRKPFISQAMLDAQEAEIENKKAEKAAADKDARLSQAYVLPFDAPTQENKIKREQMLKDFVNKDLAADFVTWVRKHAPEQSPLILYKGKWNGTVEAPAGTAMPHKWFTPKELAMPEHETDRLALVEEFSKDHQKLNVYFWWVADLKAFSPALPWLNKPYWNKTLLPPKDPRAGKEIEPIL